MKNRDLVILQLRRPVAGEPLERAYQYSRARFERLTAKGPLRYYRRVLLTEAHRAYQNLKHSNTNRAPQRQHPVVPGPQSVVAKNALRQKRMEALKTAISCRPQPAAKAILSDKPLSLTARHISQWQNKAGFNSPPVTDQDLSQADAILAARRSAQLEDEFCREVLYRLEGDLLRYDSRQELLQIAQDWNIHLFRANMLMAQIVESVRQNKLYHPASAELRFKPSVRKRGFGWKGLVLTIAVVLAAIVDVLFIRWLGR